jgi:hypothetical protein
MPAFNAGLIFPWQDQDALALDISPIVFQWKWVNRFPIFTRIRQVPASQPEYLMQGFLQRPEYVTVSGAQLAADATLTVVDASYLYNGDTLEYLKADGTVEMMEVIGDPNVTTNQISVKRGDAFTTAAAITANTQLRVISNTRTGGEMNQRGIGPTPWKNVNWIQTNQKPVEIAGLLQDTTAFRSETLMAGAQDPLDAHRMRALLNMTEDFERSIVYQRGMSHSDTNTSRAKTKGIRQILGDSNEGVGGYNPLLYQPTNYASYGPEDMIRDAFEGPASRGGGPNIIFHATDFIGGFARWKLGLTRIVDMGVTQFNVELSGFTSPLAPDVVFIPAPKLRSGTYICVNEEDLILRYMRLPTWYLRGKNGDAWQGDIISRVGVQLNNPTMHRMVEGVTGFAAA